MGLRIREATAADTSSLSALALRSKAYWGYDDAFMESCRAELTYTAADLTLGEYYIAETEVALLGFCALVRLNDRDIELEAMFVEPEHIGRGHGRALIEYAKRRAKQMGGKRLVIQGDPNATHFYLRAGGRLTGESKSASIPGRYLPTFEIEL